METFLNCEEAKKLSVTIEAEHERLCSVALDAALLVHRELGPGLLESVYQDCLAYALHSRGLSLNREVSIPVKFQGLNIETVFRADLIIEGKLLIELKAVETLQPIHLSQVITYLKLANLPLGLLINFNIPLLKDGVRRILHPSLLKTLPHP
jgi:iron complex transport system substrate-binding protein